MNDRTFDAELDGLPLPTSKEMIAIGEECVGVPRESARKIAGFDDFRPRMGKELEGQRRSRIAQQLLRRVENRIRRLDEVHIHPFNGVSYPAWAKQANIRERRAVMELGWVKGLLENGGCESIEWAENREPNLEAVEVQSEPRDCDPDAPGARVPRWEETNESADCADELPCTAGPGLRPRGRGPLTWTLGKSRRPRNGVKILLDVDTVFSSIGAISLPADTQNESQDGDLQRTAA